MHNTTNHTNYKFTNGTKLNPKHCNRKQDGMRPKRLKQGKQAEHHNICARVPCPIQGMPRRGLQV